MPISRRVCIRGLAAGALLLHRRAAAASSEPLASDATRSTLTHLGTATVLVELGPFRLLTDPAFDPAGTHYKFGPGAESDKLHESAIASDAVGRLDAVLVTHDHHADNLDRAGRGLLRTPDVAIVVTTEAGARRLRRRFRAERDGRPKLRGGLGIRDKLRGLAPWEVTELSSGDARLRIVATPCKHGPSGSPKVRQAIGFAMFGDGLPCVFVSGDTVWFDDLTGVRERLDALGVPPIDVAIVHAGGVQFPDLPFFKGKRFTFDGAEALRYARELDPRFVLPVHYGHWSHFREPWSELAATLAKDPTIGPRVVSPSQGVSWAIPAR